MSYRDLTRKEITLPSGFKCTVRARTRREDIEIGQPPAFFSRNARLQAAGKETPDPTTEEEQATLKYIAGLEKVLLLRCVMGALEKDEKWTSITDADPKESTEGEISWSEILLKDKEAIIEAINELSGLSNAGQGASDTFPDKKK